MESKQMRRVFSGIGLAFAAMLLISQLLSLLVNILVTQYAPQLLETGWYLWALSYAPLYLLAFPVFLLLMRRVPDTAKLEPSAPAALPMAEVPAGAAAPFRPVIRLTVGNMLLLILISLGIVYPLNLLTTLLSQLVASLRGTGLVNPLAAIAANSNPWVNLVFVALVAPVMEEIIFRGMLYKKLIGYGGKTYLFFSAFLFMLYHLNLYQMPYAFILGLVFAGIMYYTRSLKYSIILHICINFIGSGISGVILRYAGSDLMMVWGFGILLLSFAGLVTGIVWWVKNRRRIVLEAGEKPAPTKAEVFLNFGMLLLMLVFFVLAGMVFLA